MHLELDDYRDELLRAAPALAATLDASFPCDTIIFG